MLITKEHVARYVLRHADQQPIGDVERSQGGWTFRDHKGSGPRQASVSPQRALLLATITNHLRAPNVDWSQLVQQADRAFHHNLRVSRADAR